MVASSRSARVDNSICRASVAPLSGKATPLIHAQVSKAHRYRLLIGAARLNLSCQTMSSDVGRCVFLSSSLGSHARGRRRSLAQRSNAASATILTDRTVGRVAVRAVIGRSHVSQPGSKNPCACQARCIHSAPFGPRLLYTDPLTASIFCTTTFSRARCPFFVPRVALYFLPIHASHNPSDSQQHPNPISHTECRNDAKLVIVASYMRLLRAPICVLASPSGKLPSLSPAKVR